MTATVPLTSRRRLSKSDFKLARTCDAKLHFRENRYPDSGDLDPYLRMLAQGGYMVEALGKARFPDGIQLEYGRDPERDTAITLEHLSRPSVTLFEGTLLWNRRLARADVIVKDGDTIHLIEIKAKSFDGAEHAMLVAGGKAGVFCTDRKPLRIRSDWTKYIEDVAFQALILERLVPGVRVEPHLLLVDKSKRAQLDDIPTLFEIVRIIGPEGVERLHTARFTGDISLLSRLDVLTQVHVSNEVALVRDGVEQEAARFELLLDSPLSVFTRELGAHCRECEFRISAPERNGFRECWGPLADASPHVLDLFSVGKVKAADGNYIVQSLTQSGKSSLFDIPEDRLRKKDGTIGPEAERQLRQITHTRSGEFWLSSELSKLIDGVSYPAHFVDFEVSALALPYHAKMRPYGPVAFQWSSHTLSAPGAELVHGEWLNTEYSWPNERFARSLRAQIGDTGSVLTWSKFERSTLRRVIAELGQFGVTDPELAAWISEVAERRMVDMNEWATRHFFHPAMGGRTSIKVVLDALWKNDPTMRAQFEQWTGLRGDPERDPYAALPALEINGIVQDVREGTGAIRAYEAMMYGVERSDEEAKRRWRELLLQYCGLDTLSMVLIFEHLRRRTAGRVGLLDSATTSDMMPQRIRMPSS